MKKKDLIHLAIGMIIWAPVGFVLDKIADPASMVVTIIGGIWGAYIGHLVACPNSRILSFKKSLK